MTRRWLAGGALSALILAVALAPATSGFAQPEKKGPKDKDPKAKFDKDKDKDWGKDDPKDKDDPKGKDGPKEKRGPKDRGGPPDGPPGGARELRRAYDDLADLGPAVKAAADRTATRLYDEAKELYRAAHKAHAGGDRGAATELALAAQDVGRAARHCLRAAGPAAGDLPPPPDEGRPEPLSIPPRPTPSVE